MENPIIREIHLIGDYITREMEKLHAVQRLSDVTGGNTRVIGFLADHVDEPIYQKDVEKAFGVTRSTASRVLALMERKGLVERHSVPHDARLKQVVLTDRSCEIGKVMGAACTELTEKLLKDFTEEEKGTLLSMLMRMQQNLK